MRVEPQRFLMAAVKPINRYQLFHTAIVLETQGELMAEFVRRHVGGLQKLSELFEAPPDLPEPGLWVWEAESELFAFALDATKGVWRRPIASDNWQVLRPADKAAEIYKSKPRPKFSATR